MRTRSEIKSVAKALKHIQFDRKEKTVMLRIAGHPTISPTLFDDELTLKTNVLNDLRRLVRLGHRVKVIIATAMG